MKPEFATNRGEERVAEAIASHIRYVLDTWAKPFEVAVATAYFNPAGFELLAPELERVNRIRLLLGTQPPSPERRIRHLDPRATPEDTDRIRMSGALAGHRRSIEEDRDLLGFEFETDALAKRLIDWLRSGRVEVRRFEGGFLHGKAFLVSTDDEGVIAGSSNFTFAGLAVNRELNLGHYQPTVVRQVREWFEEIWGESEPFDLAAIYEARYEEHNPYIVYLRMLFERYGEEIEQEAAAAGTVIHLTQFQKDGLWRAKRMLEERRGVLIADDVGLGKTYLAGELIREATLDRRQRVLLVAPAALRDGPWRAFIGKHLLPVEVISFEQLTAGDHRFGINEYAMVVIDEAHAYRNPDTQRAASLRELLKGSPPKDVVMLTATPVNNGLWDLYYLLSYFVRNDAAFADVGIRSLRDHFAEAMALDPDDLSPERLFDVLDAVAVRRTRHFVRRYYPGDTIDLDGERVPISFPEPHVRRVGYDLDEVLPGFFDRFSHALDCADGHCGHKEAVRDAPVLHLARYVPSRYLVRGEAETYELQLAGLLRSGLLKRFESSAYAFAETCRRMAGSHEAFLGLLANGYVATGEALSEWAATDSDDSLDILTRIPSDAEVASRYRVKDLRRDVETDRDLLLAFAWEAAMVSPDKDPKLARLIETLEGIAAAAREEGLGEQDERDRRKTIVFTYYADTVEWIKAFLEHEIASEETLSDFRGRLVAVSGTEGDRADAMFGFAPRTTEAPPQKAVDRYDLLVSTDVLAEGVNLQQARHIVNYDLPWNPMRLVQRHGRIDRIGSPHGHVYLHCFFPDDELDALLGLEERLLRKIKQAAASVGVAGEILPGSKVAEQNFADTREDIERLQAQDPTLFASAGELGGAFSGEEYRQELRAGFQNPEVERAVRGLPWGSGSGLTRVGASFGYVFCAQVADHPDPQFRYVAASDLSRPISDTLTCLAHANATPETTRVLDEETHRAAYDAWESARRHIYEEWMKATDPANLQPVVPRAMRDAAEMLRTHPPVGLSQDGIDALLNAIEAPYGPRIQRVIREALRSSDDPREQSMAVAAAVEDLGLEPAPPAELLPVIALEDVHLICWMAIAPTQQA